MEQAILTDVQKRAITCIVQEPNLESFYLSGGTALAAFHLHHRLSDDLDFFCFQDPDKIFLHGFSEKLKTILEASHVRYERLYDRNQFFYTLENEELKIEFTKYPFLQLAEPKVHDGIKIDSFQDLAANKLMAMLDRFDPKDFVDLYFIFQQKKLEEVRRDTETKFGVKIDAIFLGGELAKVQRINALPKMLLPLTIEILKSYFSKVAQTLAPEVLG